MSPKIKKFGEVFVWENTQPLLQHIHKQKGQNFDFLDYQLQFNNAYQIIKSNDHEGFTQDFY